MKSHYWFISHQASTLQQHYQSPSCSNPRACRSSQSRPSSSGTPGGAENTRYLTAHLSRQQSFYWFMIYCEGPTGSVICWKFTLLWLSEVDFSENTHRPLSSFWIHVTVHLHTNTFVTTQSFSTTAAGVVLPVLVSVASEASVRSYNCVSVRDDLTVFTWWPSHLWTNIFIV